MKKIFIVFILSVIISTVLILPCAASMIDSFGSYNNLFDPSDVVQARFYTDLENYQVNNFYSVSLKPDTDYTFISTNGSKNFFAGSLVTNPYLSCYSFNSINYIYIPYNFSYGDYSYFEINNGSSDGQIDIIYKSPLPRDYYFLYTEILLDPGTYYFNDFSSNSSAVVSYVTYGSNYIYSGQSFTLTEITEVECRLAIYSGFNSSVTLSPMLTKDVSYNYFIPGYSSSYFSSSDLSVCTFHTSSKLSGFPSNGSYPFLIGINDVLSGSSSNLFSSNQSSENEFYLIEGKLTVDQISEIIDGNNYQNGYNSGYDQGYKVGEYDGMNSTSILKSTILTVLSGPFVVVSNALNFEIFGINIYTFIQIILTILIVAFLITRLKGRE